MAMDAAAFSNSIAHFATKFCNEIGKKANTVSSPLSAEFVLALVALGSTNEAHQELLTALGVPNDEAIRSSFASMSQKLKAIKGVTLDVANKIYVKDGSYELNEQLEKDAVNVFNAAIEKTNFNNSAAAASTINSWVESKTNKRIKDLFSSDAFSEDTRLVLVNALYFKGFWKSKFDAQFTKDEDFHVKKNTTVKVPMMRKEDDYLFGASEQLNAQLLGMEYEGGETSMVIILPNEVEGLDKMMKTLASGYDLVKDLERMHKTKVQVTIPKFKIETEIDLKQLLPKLGIKTIFNQGNSGLTKILKGNEPLYVSEAKQKAFIEVNEEGAEAAAATGMVMMLRCARMTPEFRAKHPFLYLLLGSDQHILFMGTFNAK